MKLFIAGGTGFIGSHFLKNIVYDDHFERIDLCVNRRLPKIGSPKVMVYRPCRIDDESILNIEGSYDYIVNFVGIIKETRDKKFEKVHHQGVKNLIKLAQKTGATGFVQISAAGNADTPYMNTKREAEEEIISSGLEYVILRPSFVLGPDGDFVKMLKKLLKFSPFLPVIGDGSYQVQPIFVGDLAEIVRRSILQGIKGVFGACGPDRISYLDFMKKIKSITGAWQPIVKIPLTLMKSVATIAGPLSPADRDQLKMLTSGSFCDEIRIFRLVSLSPTPLDKTIELSFL